MKGDSLKTVFRWIAALLLILLATARGAGGVFLIRGGARVAGAEARPDAPALLIGAGLLLAAFLCAAGGVLLVVRSRAARWVAGVGLATFVLGGIVNGFLLYGRPRPAGLIGNAAYAAVVVAALWRAERRH